MAKYIDDSHDAIDYPEYKAKGYAVGSGSIESSNKTVLQSRLKQAGMRWNVEQGQAVVARKTKAESGIWPVVRRVAVRQSEYVVKLISNLFELTS